MTDKKTSTLLRPTSDVVFRALMTQGGDILKSFLSAALGLGEDELSELNVHDPHMSADYEGAKAIVLDVRAKTASGMEIDIELQLVRVPGLVGRIVFYLCTLFANQLRRGDDYSSLNRAVCIVITGFRITGEERFANSYTLRNDATSSQLSDIIQVCTLELPKLKDSDTGALSDWMRFLASEDEGELDVLAARDAGIGKAVEMLKYMSKDETLRSLEMLHEKHERDVTSRLTHARKEGLAEGEARGHRESALQVARAALAKGLDVDTVCDITGLDIETVRHLRETPI
jgi:predicted transposase/invertase (TIGR01784 family)